MSETVKEVLWSLQTGCESVWVAIEGGGYDGEFSPDYSLYACVEQDLIKELIDNGCEVLVRYHASYESKIEKFFMTKILVVSLKRKK